jgi:hypothetical protein
VKMPRHYLGSRQLAGDGQHFSEYDAQVTEDILGEAAHLLRAIGFGSYHTILIGGIVPGLLVLDPPDSARPHIGTTDLDFCLSIALVEGSTAEYERIETALKSSGYEPEGSTFCWRRKTGLRPKVEFFCPENDNCPAGNLFRPKATENPTAKQNMGTSLSAMALRAGGAISADVVEVTRDVQLPDGQGVVRQTFRISGLVGFLVAKVAALTGRDKPKDAYDIVWLLEAWHDGPLGAAATVRATSAYEREDVRTALDILALEFSEVGRVGPQSYLRFMATEADDADSRAGLALRARGAVGEFIAGLRG